MSLGSRGALGITGTISFGSGILQFTSSNTADYSNRIYNASLRNFAFYKWSVGHSGWQSGQQRRIIEQVDAGTLTLTGTNPYSGGTTVGGGTLLADGSNSTGSGAVAVKNWGTLGGNGTIAPSGVSSGNAITIAFGGALSQSMVTGAPGITGGTLTLHSQKFSNFNFTTLSDFTGTGTSSSGCAAMGTTSIAGSNITALPYSAGQIR